MGLGLGPARLRRSSPLLVRSLWLGALPPLVLVASVIDNMTKRDAVAASRFCFCALLANQAG
jgi:putative copper export protein